MSAKRKGRIVFKIKRELDRRRMLAQSSLPRGRLALVYSLGIHLLLGFSGFAYWFVAENGSARQAALQLEVALAPRMEKPDWALGDPIPGIRVASRADPLVQNVTWDERAPLKSNRPPGWARSDALDRVESRPARLIFRPPARRSEACRAAGHIGVCRASLEIGRHGRVQRVALLSPALCLELRAAALASLKASTYVPALTKGQPIPSVDARAELRFEDE